MSFVVSFCDILNKYGLMYVVINILVFLMLKVVFVYYIVVGREGVSGSFVFVYCFCLIGRVICFVNMCGVYCLVCINVFVIVVLLYMKIGCVVKFVT